MAVTGVFAKGTAEATIFRLARPAVTASTMVHRRARLSESRIEIESISPTQHETGSRQRRYPAGKGIGSAGNGCNKQDRRNTSRGETERDEAMAAGMIVCLLHVHGENMHAGR